MSLQFQQNMNEEKTTFAFHPTELAGLPEDLLQTLDKDPADPAGERRILTLKYPHYMPAMKYIVSDTVRRTLQTAFDSRCVTLGPPYKRRRGGALFLTHCTGCALGACPQVQGRQRAAAGRPREAACRGGADPGLPEPRCVHHRDSHGRVSRARARVFGGPVRPPRAAGAGRDARPARAQARALCQARCAL